MKFGKELRIRSSGDFQTTFRRGRRFVDARFVLVARPNGLGHPRLGLSVGRKLGGAVRRNRLKRLVREAFRLSLEAYDAGLDLVIIPRPGAPIESLQDVQPSLATLMKKAARAFKDEMACDTSG